MQTPPHTSAETQQTEREMGVIPTYFDEYLSPDERVTLEALDGPTKRERIALMYTGLDGCILPITPSTYSRD